MAHKTEYCLKRITGFCIHSVDRGRWDEAWAEKQGIVCMMLSAANEDWGREEYRVWLLSLAREAEGIGWKRITVVRAHTVRLWDEEAGRGQSTAIRQICGGMAV